MNQQYEIKKNMSELDSLELAIDILGDDDAWGLLSRSLLAALIFKASEEEQTIEDVYETICSINDEINDVKNFSDCETQSKILFEKMNDVLGSPLVLSSVIATILYAFREKGII